MAKVSAVRVDGLRELGRALQGLGDDLGSTVARAATAAAAGVVRRQATLNAPMAAGPHPFGGKGWRGEDIVQPGALKRSIRIRRTKQKGTLTSMHEVFVRSGSNVPGEDAFYWWWVEFGSVHNIPRPFMRPAFDRTKDAAVAAMAVRIAARVKKAQREGGATR